MYTRLFSPVCQVTKIYLTNIYYFEIFYNIPNCIPDYFHNTCQITKSIFDRKYYYFEIFYNYELKDKEKS